jgi:SAM-dependent methyltransferase
MRESHPRSGGAPAVGRRSVARDQIELLGIAEGFFQSSVLFALLRLDVFERIGRDSKSAAELAGALGVRADRLSRLLNAAVVLKLLEPDGDASDSGPVEAVRYRATDASRAVLLRSAGEDYLGDWLLNLDYFREALAGLDEAVRSGRPTVDPAGHLGDDPGHTREFTLAMHNYASHRGRELSRYLDTSGCTKLLDLGCGPGTYAFHLGTANPELALYLLDLPGVLAVTREVEARYELRNDVHYLPLDALNDELPGSYDLILVSNTLHMLGEEASRDLIARLYKSVTPGGSLVIQAQYLQDDRQGARWPVFLDLIQLCITERGRNHTVAETRDWMRAAGFDRVEHTPMGLLNTNSFLRGYRNS